MDYKFRDNITWITRAVGAAILVLTLLPMTTQGLLPVSIKAPLQLLRQTTRWQCCEHKTCNIFPYDYMTRLIKKYNVYR